MIYRFNKISFSSLNLQKPSEHLVDEIVKLIQYIIILMRHVNDMLICPDAGSNTFRLVDL